MKTKEKDIDNELNKKRSQSKNSRRNRQILLNKIKIKSCSKSRKSLTK